MFGGIDFCEIGGVDGCTFHLLYKFSDIDLFVLLGQQLVSVVSKYSV